jgi:hypothetical protein
MRRWRLIVWAVLIGGLVWLMRTSPYPKPLYPIREPAPVASELASAHDPSHCGAVHGRVIWVGDKPVVPPIEVPPTPVLPPGVREVPNPNAPRIGTNGGVADAVVSLQGIDLSRSKPWTLPPATVELKDFRFVVRQGMRAGLIGIVRRDAAVEFVAREAAMHSARGRGAAFFTQMLTTPDQSVTRTLPEAGMVELSSGSGYFWMRAYLAVSDHPYVAVTDADGRFQFVAVPEGEYELVCWKASWQIARQERDPELIVPVRMEFAPPVEQRQRIRVGANEDISGDFELSLGKFDVSGFQRPRK